MGLLEKKDDVNDCETMHYMKKKKIKVCIVAICFNAYQDALKLLESINNSFKNAENIELWVVLSDNSTDRKASVLKDYSFDFNYKYVKNNNIGYFPGFKNGLDALCKSSFFFDYVLVSNVDLVVDKSFFSELERIRLDSNVGILAPSILSSKDGRDLNPKIKHRLSRRKIIILKMLCIKSYIFVSYQILSRVKQMVRAYFYKKNMNSSVKGTEYMYGAHGAFIIFTKNFFYKKCSIDYPRFLFCEELFVAEEVHKHGLKIVHNKSLVVHDSEHGSTGLKTSSFLCNEHYKSYEYILIDYK